MGRTVGDGDRRPDVASLARLDGRLVELDPAVERPVVAVEPDADHAVARLSGVDERRHEVDLSATVVADVDDAPPRLQSWLCKRQRVATAGTRVAELSDAVL